MDFNFVIILLVILYLVPEILRRMRQPREEYKYPDIPSPMPVPAPVEPTAAPAEPVMPTIAPSLVMPAEVKMAELREERNGWETIEPSVVLNGVIFAEILKPPPGSQYFGKKFASRTRISNK